MEQKPYEFHFEHSTNRFLNWRDLSTIELSAVVNGEMAPIHRNIEDMAFVDFNKDINDPSNKRFSDIKIDPKYFRTMQIMQFGMQYLLKYQSQMKQEIV